MKSGADVVTSIRSLDHGIDLLCGAYQLVEHGGALCDVQSLLEMKSVGLSRLYVAKDEVQSEVRLRLPGTPYRWWL
jgi:hypothetical protein